MYDTNQLFESTDESIGRILISEGFEELERSSGEQPFGSRYATYRDGKDRIRVVWDGRENWLLIEQMPENTIDKRNGWADVLLQRFDPKSERSKDAEEVVTKARKAVLVYLGKNEQSV